MIIIYYVDVFSKLKKNMFLIVMNLVIESRGFGYTQTTTLRSTESSSLPRLDQVPSTQQLVFLIFWVMSRPMSM